MNKKLILFMMTLSLAAAPIRAFASEYNGPEVSIEALENRAALQAATGEYRTWKQYDSRWKHLTLGNSYDDMNNSGCLVTAIATLMVHSGSADESTMDPGKLCTYLSNNGGFTSNGELYWDKVNGAVEGFSVSNYKVPLSGSRYDKLAQIKDYINRGYYVIVSVGGGAHWVAVDGVTSDGNNLAIFDPAYSYGTLFGHYSESGVDRIAVFSSTGGGQGNVNTGSSSVESYSAKGIVRVGASYLNVRSGVGTDQDYLTDSNGKRVTLQNNSQVTITGKGKDSNGNLWYRISIDGLTGYVFGAYVEISSEENNTTEGEGEPGKVNVDSVNVRKDAGTSHSVLAVAPKNADVTVYGEKSDSAGKKWYKIKYNDTVGYMLAEYVTLEEEKEETPETTYEAKSGKVNASSVNVRSGAGTGNSIVGNLSSGAAVTVVGEAKDSSQRVWYKIEYSGGSGYMLAEYITLDSASNNNNNSESYEKKNGKVNADVVNVRSGAGTGNSVVGSLSSGSAVTIVGEAKDSSGAKWYKIEYSGGSGYMHSDYVTVTNGSENNSGSTNTPTYESKAGKVNDDYVNVRSGAGTNHSAVTSLRVNTAVTVVGEEKDGSGATWYKIKYAGGEGYMRADFITIGNSSSSDNSNNSSSNNSGSTSQNYPMEGVEGKEGIVNSTQVNVRKEANANAEVAAVLKKDVSVLIESAVKDSSGNVWYKIGFAGTSGYMMAQYITIQ